MKSKKKRPPGRPLRLRQADRFLLENFSTEICWNYSGIARELGISKRSVCNWISQYGLPVKTAPSGLTYAYRFMIHRWLYLYDRVKDRKFDSKEERQAAIEEELAKLRAKRICPHCGGNL